MVIAVFRIGRAIVSQRLVDHGRDLRVGVTRQSPDRQIRVVVAPVDTRIGQVRVVWHVGAVAIRVVVDLGAGKILVIAHEQHETGWRAGVIRVLDESLDVGFGAAAYFRERRDIRAIALLVLPIGERLDFIGEGVGGDDEVVGIGSGGRRVGLWRRTGGRRFRGHGLGHTDVHGVGQG